MGQTHSNTPDTVDVVHMQVVRHAKVLSEMNSLTYEEFKASLESLNELSRKCIDTAGKQLVFLIKKGTDTSMLWKATVKIACVKVDPISRHVENYKLLNLKQFLCVFKTFQSHLQNLISSEGQRDQRELQLHNCDQRSTSEQQITASLLLEHVNHLVGSQTTNKSPVSGPQSDYAEECSICLDRCTEVILPCTHSFCAPCIEQWNVNNKTCPICCETLDSTDDTWIMSELPGVEEINEKICNEFMNLSEDK